MPSRERSLVTDASSSERRSPSRCAAAAPKFGAVHTIAVAPMTKTERTTAFRTSPPPFFRPYDKDVVMAEAYTASPHRQGRVVVPPPTEIWPNLAFHPRRSSFLTASRADSAGQRLAQKGGGLSVALGQCMRVAIKRHRHLSVAVSLSNGPDVDSRRDEQRDTEVPQVMEAERPQLVLPKLATTLCPCPFKCLSFHCSTKSRKRRRKRIRVQKRCTVKSSAEHIWILDRIHLCLVSDVAHIIPALH